MSCHRVLCPTDQMAGSANNSNIIVIFSRRTSLLGTPSFFSTTHLQHPTSFEHGFQPGPFSVIGPENGKRNQDLYCNDKMTGGSREEGSGSGSEGGKKGNSLPDSRSPPVLRHPLPVRKRPSSIAVQSLEEMRANGDKSPNYARNLKTGGAYMLGMMKEPFRGKDHEVAAALPPETTTGEKDELFRRLTFFGVNLARQCRMTGRPIPLLVEKCIAELDKRALTTHGLYCVSAAQTQCKELCRAFELKAKDVDLSELPPYLIASVLKYYLRQLPQPLLAYRLYSCFITSRKSGNRLS
ncbi:rho GTPase-activating protein 29-like [Oscarella lobularis]|uniref:rho GTPase-activating protein 29-like n=1 Tax=Oscarella lobularis TaxID=121494 RepID=UPI0033137CEB